MGKMNDRGMEAKSSGGTIGRMLAVSWAVDCDRMVVNTKKEIARARRSSPPISHFVS